MCYKVKRESEVNITIKKGDIYYADLTPVVGSEQGGIRPVLIIQNDIGNYYSPTVIAAAITSRFQKHSIPTHIQLEQEVRGLRRNSVILLEQVRTIDRMRLKRYIGSLNGSMMQKVDRAILISFGLKEQNRAYRQSQLMTGASGRRCEPFGWQPTAVSVP